MTNSRLFSGETFIFGGLSNEEEFVLQCPPAFLKNTNNDWSRASMAIFYNGGNISHWKWKSSDPETRLKQMACFRGLLGTFGIKHEHKEAVAGWMLSEMLEEVPEHIPK